jgi:hypothetical protein
MTRNELADVLRQALSGGEWSAQVGAWSSGAERRGLVGTAVLDAPRPPGERVSASGPGRPRHARRRTRHRAPR